MIKNILEFIGKGKTEKAIIELRKFLTGNESKFEGISYKEFYSRAILLSNRYYEFNNNLDKQSFLIEQNKIVSALIELCLDIEKNYDSSNLEINQILPKTRVDFVLNGNLNEFSDERKAIFKNMVSSLLDFHQGEFEIKMVTRGSIIVSADIPTEKLGILYKLRDLGVLKNYANIVDTYLTGEQKKFPQTEGITFTTTAAFAGATIGDENFEKLMKFSLPGVVGNGMVAFQIEGNSMDPVIQHSDIVVCRKVENASDINDNEIYAVRSQGNIWVKYVQKIFNKSGRIVRFKLISANYFDNDPFDVNLTSDVLLFKVIRIIKSTDHESSLFLPKQDPSKLSPKD